MSLLVSKRGCHIWHQRLHRVILLNKSKICSARSNTLYYPYSTSHHHDPSIKKTRNIGIIAHIDAVRNKISFGAENLTFQQGKTTTTERMLYYSGFTRRIGGMV